MKKILFTLLTAISLTTFGQNNLTRNDYVYPYPAEWGDRGINGDINKVYNENLSMYKMKDPVLNLQLGAKDQLRANNHKWAAVGLNVAAYSFLMIHISSLDGPADTGNTPYNVLATIAGVAGVGFGISSAVYERRAAKRIYWGMSGVTIPLN